MKADGPRLDGAATSAGMEEGSAALGCGIPHPAAGVASHVGNCASGYCAVGCCAQQGYVFKRQHRGLCIVPGKPEARLAAAVGEIRKLVHDTFPLLGAQPGAHAPGTFACVHSPQAAFEALTLDLCMAEAQQPLDSEGPARLKLEGPTFQVAF